MSDDLSFAPDAIVSDDSDFSSLVEGQEGQDSNKIQEELKSASFGQVDVNDYSEFTRDTEVPQSGEFKFSVEQKYLKEATNVTRLTASASKSAFGAVEITLYEDKVRLATFNQSAFAEINIPTHEATVGLVDGKEISFIFDQNVLSKIAATFTDAVIHFTYVAEKSLLLIESGKTRLELSAYDRTEFVAYRSKVGEPTVVGLVNPENMRRGINYASTFVKRDDIQLNLSIVDIRDQSIIGGTYAAIGVYKSEALGDLSLKIKYDILGIVEKVLAKFHKENTSLSETDSFYILRDENLIFGFEKSSHNFPPVDKFFEIPVADYGLVPRPVLLNSLYKLSVVSVDKDLLVRVRIEGSGNDGVITLETQDASGKISRDDLQIFRQANGESNFDPIDVHLNIASLIKVVSHFETANVRLELLGNKAMLVKDEDEEFTASTIMSVLDPAKVQAEKVKQEDAA